MDMKKYLPLSAALLALGIAGPAVALADDGESDHGGPQVTAPASGSVNDQGDDNGSVADEQKSGDPEDVQNTDLAGQVEQEDAADQNDQGDDTSTADQQKSGDQSDSQNSDLANEVEQEDGVVGSGSTDAEDQVEDSNDD